MRDIFLIADTHFQQKNILTFVDNENNLIRGARFSSTEEMDEHMIDRWNSVVKNGDIVYHLGDIFFGSKEGFRKIASRLNGKKRLVAGNHDDIKWIAKEGIFSKILVCRTFTEFGLFLSHIPVHEASLVEKELFNVHGHYHHNPSPPGPYRCVSVEQIEYTPISIEEVRIK